MKKKFSCRVFSILLIIALMIIGNLSTVMAKGAAPAKPVLEGEGISIGYHYTGGKLTSYNVNDFVKCTGTSGSVTINISLSYSDGTKAVEKTKSFQAKAGKRYHISCDASFLKSEDVKQTSYITISSSNMKQKNNYKFEKTRILSIGEIKVEELMNNSNLSDLKVYSGNQLLKLDGVKNGYTAYVGANVNSVAISAVAEDVDAVVTLNDQLLKKSERRTVPLKTGNNEINIKVTAPDKTTYTTILLSIIKSSSTGANKWTKSYGYLSGIAAGKSNELYAVAGQGKSSYLLSITADGKEKRLYTADGELFGPVVGQDGSIYVWTKTKLIALAASGKTKWSYGAKSGVGDVCVGTDNKVYFAYPTPDYTDKKVYVLSSSGKLLWEFNTGYLYTNIFTGLNGTFYYSVWDEKKRDDGHILYALNADFTKKWEFQTGGFINGMTFDKNGLMIITLSCKKLEVLDPKDGNKKLEIVSEAVPERIMTGADGTIYTVATGTKELGKDNDGYTLISQYGLLIAFNQDGTKKWELNLGDNIYGLNIAPDGMVYVSSSAPIIIKVDPSGVKKQEFLMSGTCTANPTIMPDGSVYAGNENKIYSFGK